MTTNNFSIRKYTPADEWLLKESVNDTYLGDIALTKKQSDIQVFVIDGKNVGFAIPRKDPDGKYRTGPIYVSPGYRRKGIAGKFTKEYFKDKPGRAWIEENNVSSQKLFESVGFKRTARSTIFENEKLWEYIKPSGNTQMLQQFTISNEVISVDVSRELGKVIQAQVAKMRSSYEIGGTVSQDSLKGLGEAVKMTGLNVEFISTIGDSPDAWMATFQYWGHQGTTWSKYMPQQNTTSKDGLKYVTKVDLKKLHASGPMVDELKFKSNISTAFFMPKHGYTDEEITGIILHECGHAFNLFVTLGDYIYLNYMLSDGIDVLLGNKKNEYNLEVLDHTWMEKNIDKDLREEYANKRTPDQARRAILSTWKKAPRHYLFDNPGSAHRREEQMADLFASRLGYGRAVVTGLDRLYKAWGMSTDMRSSWLGNLVRVAVLLVFLPFSIIWMLTCSGTNDFDFAGRYDNPKERVMKVRMDLITQLKTIKDRSLVGPIQADIDCIDELLKEYHTGTNLYDYIEDLVSPVARREKRLQTHEENLESLLNNSLFVEAYRYKA